MPERYACAPRYNIARGQSAPAIVGGVERTLRWGLLAPWRGHGGKRGPMIYEAPEDAIASTPLLRNAKRCLIPADGFFEWQKLADGKQPWLLRMANAEPFALAGLWSRWKDRESGVELDSCTIVTTAANELVAPLHDRMPVIVPREAYALWLDPEVVERERLDPLLVPYSADAREAYRVSRLVNSPANDDPACLEPAA